MRHTASARAARRHAPRLALASLAVATAAIIGGLGDRSRSSSASAFTAGHPPISHRALLPQAPSSAPAISRAPGAHRRPVTQADGALPAGVTAFDAEYAGIANLDPALLRALRDATSDAAADGVELFVNSGWRSREYQDRLLREAVAEYGSEADAARWVATADTSPHVSGDAVDIGGSDATAWLSDHGASYGLCRIYRNEPWHFELRPEAMGRGCPPMFADPTDDPRMQR